MFDRMNGIGAHEVIIETPDHDRSLASMSEPEIERVLWAYRERMLDLKQDGRLRYILVFKNHGAAAGATLEHTALAADRAADRAGLRARGDRRRAAALRGEGALRLLRHRAPGAARRTRASSRRTPTSSRWRRTRRGFRSRRGCCRGGTARGSRRRRGTSTRAWRGCCKSVLQRMDRALESPPYNLIVHTSPFSEETRRFLSLARRDHAEADAGGRLRVGHRVLHQPDVAGGSGAGASRGEDLTIVWSAKALAERDA